MRHLRHSANCDCLGCFGVRLVVDFLFAGLAAVLLLSLLVEPPSEAPLLIDAGADR